MKKFLFGIVALAIFAFSFTACPSPAATRVEGKIEVDLGKEYGKNDNKSLKIVLVGDEFVKAETADGELSAGVTISVGETNITNKFKVGKAIAEPAEGEKGVDTLELYFVGPYDTATAGSDIVVKIAADYTKGAKEYTGIKGGKLICNATAEFETEVTLSGTAGAALEARDVKITLNGAKVKAAKEADANCDLIKAITTKTGTAAAASAPSWLKAKYKAAVAKDATEFTITLYCDGTENKIPDSQVALAESDLLVTLDKSKLVDANKDIEVDTKSSKITLNAKPGV